jgi:hypothetical protein
LGGQVGLRLDQGKPAFFLFRSASCGRESSLRPDPIALRVGNVTIVATFDATRPANTWFRLNILSAIQPTAVYRALHGVYARLVDGVRVVRHSNEHVISVG